MFLPTARSVIVAAPRAACVRPAANNRSNNNRRLHQGAGA
jgi:hypothetical protein